MDVTPRSLGVRIPWSTREFSTQQRLHSFSLEMQKRKPPDAVRGLLPFLLGRHSDFTTSDQGTMSAGELK